MELFCTEMKGFMGRYNGGNVAPPRCDLDSRRSTVRIAAFLFLFAGLIKGDTGSQGSEGQLKGLSLEQLGNIEVTTASKQPVKVSRTPAAIYVITEEDIRRSGATSIPEVLRLAPGVDVARIDPVKW